MATYDVQRTVDCCDMMKRVATAAMQDFSRLAHICHYVLETQRLDGAIVEFGCCAGDTAKLIAAITNKEMHLYDSFKGLPDIPGTHIPGAMATTVRALTDNFQSEPLLQYRYPPIIHPGWFSKISPDDVPQKISFAHIDADLYESTIQALNLVYPNLVPGGVILVDDYGCDWFTGPKKATDEFFVGKPEKVKELGGVNGAKSLKAAITKL